MDEDIWPTPDDDGFEPWDAVMRALTLQAEGTPLTELQSEIVEYSATCLAAAALVVAGGDTDDVVRQFEERPHTFRLTYEPDTDEIGIEVSWEDGEVTVTIIPEPAEQ